jgi:Calcineurin-like phosphoesterase
VCPLSDEYSYRDARLSLWQAAVEAYVRKPNDNTGKTATAASVAVSESAEQANRIDLMLPVHMVAHSIKAAGKPFDWLVHEVKKGILDLKAQFDPLEDCANAAAHFLWAQIEGNEPDSNLYAGELQKSVCDAVGWPECLTTYLGYKALLQNPVYRPNQNVVVDLGTIKRLAIIGDWGVGDDVARNVLQQVAALKPDLLLHLGDVYYAGTKTEVKVNFLDICRSVLGNIPIYTLCGNHDMYSGGEGYYWLLDEIGQKSSYFCLQNEDWMFLAMDTGFHDNNPFNVSTNMTKLVSQEGWSEASWHLNQISRVGNRKLVILSHHQLFSPFGSVGSVDGAPYAYNPNLYDVFKPMLPKIEWWFWGHEHTLGIFPPYMGLKRGRCVGASAVPVFHDQQSYASAPGLKTPDGTMPTWNRNGVLGFSKNMYNNCFAMMTLNGASATVDYYEVPPLEPAHKFDDVTDVV